jgi:hypothetical protein
MKMTFGFMGSSAQEYSSAGATPVTASDKNKLLFNTFMVIEVLMFVSCLF